MKLAHWIAALCLLMSAPSLAAVKERQVALPDNLGTAVLYSAKGKKAGPGGDCGA
jgi:hypothetical protein